MIKFLKKPIVIGSIIFLIAIFFVARHHYGGAGSTSGAAMGVPEWEQNLQEIVCAETGKLITLQGDWHRWKGKNFDGVVIDSTLNLNWTEKKPEIAWIFRYSGAGFSGPAVVGTTLYMSGAAEGHDFAFALDTKTGNLKWKQTLDVHFVQSYGDGPRGTITVDEEYLYLILGGGKIYCLSAIDGKIMWQRDLVADFDGRIMGSWGYSESPIVDGNLVICTPGGKIGTMVALDKKNGSTVWVSKEWTDQTGYSSPIFAVVDGVRQYIQQSASGVSGVRAEDGKLLWSVKIPGYKVAVIPTPIYKDNIVYVTAGYNAGCAGIKLSKKGEIFQAEIIFNNKNMVNHHGGVVLVDDFIYGFSDASGWVCQNFRTGETVWNTGRANKIDKVGKGAIIAANNRLILLEETTGNIVLINASPDGWKQLCILELPERTKISSKNNMVWTHPVIANGKLFIRDQDLLFAFNLSDFN